MHKVTDTRVHTVT